MLSIWIRLKFLGLSTLCQNDKNSYGIKLNTFADINLDVGQMIELELKRGEKYCGKRKYASSGSLKGGIVWLKVNFFLI